LSQRILIIDDETNIRQMIRLALEHSGYEVDGAEDGPQGLALLKAGKPYDLILVDYRMPGMSGADVQVQLHRLAPKAHVIMITAFGTIDLAMDAIHAGATDFLRKPFSMETLRNAVSMALATAKCDNPTIPIDKVVRPFSRANINGFSFQVNEDVAHADPDDNAIHAHFIVRQGDTHSEVTVAVQRYVIELAKAYLDTDDVPGGDSFWRGLGEEALAEHLWRHSSLPTGDLSVKELSPALKHWLDSVSTIQVHAK